ncbi:MAG TPA: protein-signal peptide and transmembrane prediction [Candidatus Saccharimonadia bacterium]|nr:protein-signal peptide and transmembrane prediction [Candidatus Saccharimonadia bacterium]
MLTMNRALFSVALLACVTSLPGADEPLTLHLRSRKAAEKGGTHEVKEGKASWAAKNTALIICDMWDDHWCKSASARVAEMAGPMNEMIAAARAKGIFIIHAPSSVTGFYKETPQRKLAIAAPFARARVPLAKAERWGTNWCWTDAKHEGVLPIDDTDMGCSCTGAKCTVREAWTRQIAAIKIEQGDAITDNGQEVWNLIQERGIEHVILCGVHLNMCVLGRPFAIREMVYQGVDVALVRDMTDTMYNPERPPGVDHFTGTDLVVEHVEKYWCPSFLSTDLTSKPAFHFKEDKRAK